MPGRGKGYKGKRTYKKRPITKKEVAKIARSVVVKQAETKTKYTEVDEVAITPGTAGYSTQEFCKLSRADADQTPVTPVAGLPPFREGKQVNPLSFTFKGWVRPRALVNDGDEPGDPAEQFQQAMYLRVIFLKHSTMDLTVKQPEQNLNPSKQTFFIGQNGLSTSLETDYSDIYKPLNWKVTGKPLMDKVFFIPNQYQMRNTKTISFTHRFGKNEKLEFLQNTMDQDGANSDCPHKVISLHMFARYANDDNHLFYENLELSGTGIFKFQDF